jgi:hypothetical protein
MIPTEEAESGPMDSLIADFRLSIKRLKEKPLKSLEEITKELTLNVYPSLIALAENVAEVDEVIQELVDQQESYIQKQLAVQIFATLTAGGVLVELIKEEMATFDDLKRKKFAASVHAFEHSAELTAMGVTEAIGEDEDEDEDEDEKTEPSEPETEAPTPPVAS